MLMDKPTDLPATQPDGAPLKSLTSVILDRRATPHFDPQQDVPEDVLRAILLLAGQAPSGYNLQPWRFVVVRDPENRKRLQRVAYGQPKVAEAPVVIIALGEKKEFQERAEEIFLGGVERGLGSKEKVDDLKRQALDFVTSMDLDMWVNRHVMIAVTTMMYVAEAYGFDTAPMEGFDPDGVRSEFGIPSTAAVVALLGIGRLQGPDKKYPGRLPLEEFAFRERYNPKPAARPGS
jgi:nitroreductase